MAFIGDAVRGLSNTVGKLPTPFSPALNILAQYTPKGTSAKVANAVANKASQNPYLQKASNFLVGPAYGSGSTPVQDSGSLFGDLIKQQEQGGNPTNNQTNNGSGGSPTGSNGYYDPSTGTTFGSQDEFNREIDNAYNSSFDYLNQVEGQLRSDLPGAIQSAEENYNLNDKQLTDQFGSVNSQLNLTGDQNQMRKEQALAQNRRLYSELNMGAQQRFGGASSASQAASEILRVEQQRQQGRTVQQASEVAREIEMKRVDVENEFNTQKLKLSQAKQEAIATANREFQNKLLEINSKRADLNMNKGQAKLNALQDLRNKVFQIQVQNMQFQQTLEAQKQAAQLNLSQYSNYANSAQSSVDQTFQNALASNAYNPSTDTKIQANTNGNVDPNLAGQIVRTPNYKKYPTDGFSY